MNSKLLYLLVIALAFAGCTHKAGTVATLPSPAVLLCDSTHVTYSSDIKPIFTTHCYSCHSTKGTSGDGLDLEDTTSIRDYLKNGFRGDGVYGSKLYHCMIHSAYAQQMPPTYILDTCSLSKVHYWLSIGAPM